MLTFAIGLALLFTACGSSSDAQSVSEESGSVLSVAGEQISNQECNHNWIEATCTDPRTCSICGEIEGVPLGHTWLEATCTEPKTCSICGETEGEPLGHTWLEATCTESKTCSVCGESEGEPLGHDVVGLSCTDDGTCSRCGEIIPAPGHDWVDPTCTTPYYCSVCGETWGEPLGHTTSDGVCERCGVELYGTHSGSGDDVVDISVGDGIYCVHFTNSGSRNFIVKSYDATGSRDLLINEIGAYNGYVLLLGTAPFSFEITSSGNWTYQVIKLVETDQTSFSGTGDYVTDKFTASSGTWEFTHSGESNFIVRLYTTSGRTLLVNEIGSYSGKKVVNIPLGSYAVLEIKADGDWSIGPAG